MRWSHFKPNIKDIYKNIIDVFALFVLENYFYKYVNVNGFINIW